MVMKRLGVPASMRGSFSLEALLVFVAVTIFWSIIYSGVAPQLQGMQEQVVQEELMGECLKVTNTIDTMATYGAESIYLDIIPYFKESMERGILFCQEHEGCRCDENLNPPKSGCEKTIAAVKINETWEIQNKVSCKTLVADWIDILGDGKRVYKCDEIDAKNVGGNFTIKFGSYFEKPKRIGKITKDVRDCWE